MHGLETRATGEAITQDLSPIPVASLAERGADEIVDLDLSCRSCGYNLRGLTFGANCPECNTAVALSAKSDLLRFADPNWTKRLLIGARIIALGVVLELLLIIAEMLVPRFLDSTQLIFFYRFGRIFPVATHFVGWWLMTQRDPSGMDEAQLGGYRRFIRIANGVHLAQSAFVLAAWGTSLSKFASITFYLFLNGITIFYIVALGIKMHFLMKLARRIPSEPLMRNARRLRAVVPTVHGLSAAINIAFYIYFISIGISGPSRWIVIFGFVSGAIRVVGFILEVLILIFLIAYARAIMTQRQTSLQDEQSAYLVNA
jgi:hypothetical protein